MDGLEWPWLRAAAFLDFLLYSLSSWSHYKSVFGPANGCISPPKDRLEIVQ